MVVFGGNGKREKDKVLPDPRVAIPPPHPNSADFYGEPHGQAYPKVDMKQLEHDTTTDKIAEIALLMRSLTYGEFIQMTNEMKAIDPDAQVIKPESTLAGVLHEWSERKRP